MFLEECETFKLQFHCSQSSLWACRVLCQHEK